jgi:heptosyltransferase III
MDPGSVQRVLIYRLGSLGDTVVAVPALHLIERTFPNARRLLLTNNPVQSKAPPARAILEGSELVHGYLSYPVGTRSPRELLRLWWQIRNFNPQLLIYLMAPRGDQALRRDATFFRLAGIHNVVGVPWGELAQYRHDSQTGLWEAEAERLLRCVRELGDIDGSDLANWDLRLTPAERSRAVQELSVLNGDPFIAVAIGGKFQTTDWGTENWRALLQRLSERMPNHSLLMLGSKEDRDASEVAASLWSGRRLNLCGNLSPRETAAVVSTAELFLGRDSGPKYLAAIAGVPCAVVYSARNLPGNWFPPGKFNRNVFRNVECGNCQLEVCIEQRKKCIVEITVDEMLLAALEAWQAGRHHPKA